MGHSESKGEIPPPTDPFFPHKLHISAVTKSALSNPANLRIIVPRPSWPVGSALDDLRPSRRVSHLPLAQRFQDARERVRQRAQQAVEAAAFSPTHLTTHLGTPAERFEAIVFAYQDLVHLMFAFRRFRHRTHYLPKMRALLERTAHYYQARAAAVWKRLWIKSIKHNFSLEERAWKGFVQGTLVRRTKYAFRKLRRNVSQLRNQRLDDFKLAQRIRGNALFLRAFNRMAFPVRMQCFEALFDHCNQTGSTTEERARADVHFTAHRKRHVLRTWRHWSVQMARERWPPALQSDLPQTRSRVWTSRGAAALPNFQSGGYGDTACQTVPKGTDILRKLYGSDTSDRLVRVVARPMGRRRRDLISMLYGVAEDARLSRALLTWRAFTRGSRVYYSLGDLRRGERLQEMPTTIAPGAGASAGAGSAGAGGREGASAVSSRRNSRESLIMGVDMDMGMELGRDMYTYQAPSHHHHHHHPAPGSSQEDGLVPPPGVIKGSGALPAVPTPVQVNATGPGRLLSKRQRKAMLHCRRRSSCPVLRRHAYQATHGADDDEGDDDDAATLADEPKKAEKRDAFRLFHGYHEGGYVKREGVYHYGDFFRDSDDRGFPVYAPKKEVLVAYFDSKRLAMGFRSVVVDYESGSSVFGASAGDDEGLSPFGSVFGPFFALKLT